MTRSTQLTQVVSGQTKHRAGARGVPAPVSTKFLSFEDNGGAFHWALVADSGDRPRAISDLRVLRPRVLRAHRRAGTRPCDGPRLSGMRARPPGQEPTLTATISHTDQPPSNESLSSSTPSTKEVRL